MSTLFIADLHLDAARPQVTDLFLRFLREEAAQADALYVLGDLFESWIGDDDPQSVAEPVAAGLKAVADAGVPTWFMRGNRDFLLGREYAARAGFTLLPDPCVAVLYGRPTLLMHGDLLCTDDVAYQAFRARSRDPQFQQELLARPIEQRQAIAQQARAASKAYQQGLRAQRESAADTEMVEDITDVAPATVEATLARYGCDRLIHGHTHRPAIHALTAAGSPRTRIVLGDWYTQGSVLRVDADGVELATL